jgi:8-oxo-dGTP pyrophosphatase MutT (NUDIX family)
MTVSVAKPGAYVPPHMRVQSSIAPLTMTRVTRDNASSFTRKEGVGMILCAKVHDEIRYGLVKRRMGYGMHIILTCLVRDPSCFAEICNEERNALLHVCEMREGYREVFHKLWTETMFADSDSDYSSALLRFMARKEYTKEMLMKTQPIFPHGIWGFPKGAPNAYEDDFSCALREMAEETSIRPEDITVLPVPKQHERFKRWGYTYLVASVNVPVQHEIIPRTQNTEISEVRWCSLSEALHLIPDVMEEKKALLSRLHTTMQRYA